MNFGRLCKLIACRHHYQNVDIAINMGFTVGMRPKQDDPIGLKRANYLLREPPNHLHRHITSTIPGLGLGRGGRSLSQVEILDCTMTGVTGLPKNSGVKSISEIPSRRHSPQLPLNLRQPNWRQAPLLL